MPTKTATDEPITAELATTDLTPATIDATPAPLVDEHDEWADVHDGDMTGDPMTSRLPYLAINRKLGGGFVDPDTGEKLTTLDFVWLARGRSRAQWDLPFDGRAADEDKAPRCRSFDGITSDPTSPVRKAIECSTCPFNRFDGDHVTRCHRSVEAMVFLADSTPGGGRLMRIRFGGMAEAVARAYWDSFKTRVPKRPSIAFLTECSLKEVETDNGTFLVPSFVRMKELSRAEAQPLIRIRDEWIEAWRADIADTVARGESAEAPGNDGANGPTTYEPFPEYEGPTGADISHLTGVPSTDPLDEPF